MIVGRRVRDPGRISSPSWFKPGRPGNSNRGAMKALLASVIVPPRVSGASQLFRTQGLVLLEVSVKLFVIGASALWATNTAPLVMVTSPLPNGVLFQKM